MKKLPRGARTVSVTLSFALLLVAACANAATSPSLGFADTFGILSSTYTNTGPGTTINGDLGYTIPPVVSPTVNGTTHMADGTYNQAGIDQGVALVALNNEVCTFTFPIGAVDLAANIQFPAATYAPGVYCITGAASIGAGGITLSGAGTYIFRMTGELTTEANSVVTLDSGASDCDVWWTPIGETTLGANSTFAGTVIDAAGITIGSTVTWAGRALAFGGTVTTDIDTISVSSCSAPSATLTVTKTVVNDDGGVLGVSDFPLFVGGVPVTSGVASTTLTPGAYTVTETSNAGYTAGAWGGDCAANGTITLADGDNVTCTITNNDIAAGPTPSATLTVTKTVINDDDGTLAVSDFPLFIDAFPVVSGVATTTLPPGTYTVSETGDADYDAGDWGGDCAADGSITLADGDVMECTITNDDESDSSGGNGSSSRRSRSTATEPSSAASSTGNSLSSVGPLGTMIPGLPNTGFGPPDDTFSAVATIAGILGTMLLFYFIRRKRTGV